MPLPFNDKPQSEASISNEADSCVHSQSMDNANLFDVLSSQSEVKTLKEYVFDSQLDFEELSSLTDGHKRHPWSKDEVAQLLLWRYPNK